MIRARVTEAQLALMLLTRLPAGQIKGEVAPTAQIVWAFPVVGALIGACASAVHWAATVFGLPPFAAALLAIATAALLTGGLHEDGLADMADGMGGGRDKAQKLAIMRDSHLGSYGALTLFLVLALTASGIAVAGSPPLFIAIGALSRTAMLLPMVALPPARGDGLGHAATLSINRSILAALALTFLLILPALAFWPVLAAFALTLIVGVLAKRQLGGQTGDVLGATQKLAECAAWLAASATV